MGAAVALLNICGVGDGGVVCGLEDGSVEGEGWGQGDACLSLLILALKYWIRGIKRMGVGLLGREDELMREEVY